jgi:hypothetical protein
MFTLVHRKHTHKKKKQAEQSEFTWIHSLPMIKASCNICIAKEYDDACWEKKTS